MAGYDGFRPAGENSMKKNHNGRESIRKSKTGPDAAKELRASSSYVSYRYSRQSISLSGDGRTRISARRESMLNGRVESEEFEGTLDGEDRFHDMARRLHDRFLAETDRLMAPLSHLLPHGPAPPENEAPEEIQAGTGTGTGIGTGAGIPLSEENRSGGARSGRAIPGPGSGKRPGPAAGAIPFRRKERP